MFVCVFTLRTVIWIENAWERVRVCVRAPTHRDSHARTRDGTHTQESMLFYAWMKWIRQALHVKSMYLNSLINFFSTPFLIVLCYTHCVTVDVCMFCSFTCWCLASLCNFIKCAIKWFGMEMLTTFSMSPATAAMFEWNPSYIHHSRFDNATLFCDSVKSSKHDAWICGCSLKWKYSSALKCVSGVWVCMCTCVETTKLICHMKMIESFRHFATQCSASKLINYFFLCYG